MTIGYAVIGLENTKFPENVGGTLRAAQVFGASAVIINSTRVNRKAIKHPSNTTKTQRNIVTLFVEDLTESIPYDCIPVAIEMLDDAECLTTFKHPKRAFYIFGAEDKTLRSEIIDVCKYTVKVPSRYCLNLAACVNVVLYDRTAKLLNNT